MKIIAVVPLIAALALQAAPGNLKLSVTVSAVDKAGVVEPALSPWKTQGRVIHRFKGYSEITTLDGDDWLQKQGDKVVKAILRIQNTSKETQSVPLPLLSGVVLRSAGAHRPALAFYSSSQTLVVGMEGKSNEIVVAPGESVELLYYVPAFHGDASIEAAGLGTSTVHVP